MLKIEQLFYSIQVRNHLKSLIDSNLFPSLTKERAKEIKEVIRKIDNTVLDSSILALKEMEENINPMQKVIAEQETRQEVMTLVDEALKFAKEEKETKLTAQIGEQKISVPTLTAEELWQKNKNLSIVEVEKHLVTTPNENKEKKTSTTKEKRTFKSKTKEEIIVEPDSKLEAVTMNDFTAPQTLSEVQQSGKRGIFRRKN